MFEEKAFRSYSTGEYAQAEKLNMQLIVRNTKNLQLTASLLQNHMAVSYYQRSGFSIPQMVANYRLASLGYRKENKESSGDVSIELQLCELNLARGLVLEGKINEAKSTLEAIAGNTNDASLLFRVYALLVRVNVMLEMRDGAFECLRRMKGLLSTLGSYHPDICADWLLDLYEESYKCLNAWLRCACDMPPEESMKQDIIYNCLLLIKLAGQAFKQGDYDKSMELLNEMLARAMNIEETENLNAFVLESQFDDIAAGNHVLASLYAAYLQNKACIYIKIGKSSLSSVYASKAKRWQQDHPFGLEFDLTR